MYKVIFFIAVMSLFPSIHAQLNKVVFDTIAQKDILIGECNREGLMLPVFAEFYNQEYRSYIPDQETLPLLIAKGNHYRIVIVIASWCSDSKEQVPRFFKIADSIGFAESNIQIISVDKKKMASGFEKELMLYDIEMVPTFIYFRGGNEIGRIVETPEESLEIDWLKILEK